MNSKLIKASLAGTAALALAAGGTTFAAWSDFAVNEANVIGADVLALDVAGNGTAKLDDIKMSPGGVIEREFLIVSRDGDAVPSADLSLTVQDLISRDNGCGSNSEALIDTCEGEADLGEFEDQVNLKINVGPAKTGNACAVTSDMTNLLTANGIQGLQSLSALEDRELDLLIHRSGARELAPGHGVCVALILELPKDATDLVQSDSVDFDVRFDLEQVFPTSTP